jgi:hypothetical protein
MRWAGPVACIVVTRYRKDFRGKKLKEGKIEINRKEMLSVDVNWTDQARDRNKYRAVVNTAMNIRVTSNSGICWNC